jgi:hypothetical protein
MKCMKIITLEEHYRTHAIEKAAEKLDVPTCLSKTVQDAYYSGFDPVGSAFFATTGWQRPVCEELEGAFI